MTRSVRTTLLTAGVLVLALAPFGIAAGSGAIHLGTRNGTAVSETKIISSTPGTDAPVGGYTTRQSNLSTTGGGAFYGCRAAAAGAGHAVEPCVRANNLSTGRAFEFNATHGVEGGLITVGNGGDATRPFSTNATGVATGLNADRVDGADAAALRSRWALVGADGKVAEQSGGWKVLQDYDASGNIYLDAGVSLEGRGLSATIAAPGSGEVAVGRCASAAVSCPEAFEKAPGAVVVSPRNSDGSVPAGTTADPRKAFHLVVTE